MAPRTETFALWDPETGKKTMTFKGHTALVVGLAFSPDCKTMASTGDDYTVRLWDVARGKNLATFKDVPAAWAGMGCPAFSPDGKVLACGYWYQGVDGANPGVRHPALRNGYRQGPGNSAGQRLRPLLSHRLQPGRQAVGR